MGVGSGGVGAVGWARNRVRAVAEDPGVLGVRVSQRIWQFDHLSRWLDREGLRVDQLTPARQEQFLAARRAAGYRTWVSARSLRVPLAYLREVVPMPVPVPDGPLEGAA
jgi:hypothetical protein